MLKLKTIVRLLPSLISNFMLLPFTVGGLSSALLLSALLSACGTQPIAKTDGHLTAQQSAHLTSQRQAKSANSANAGVVPKPLPPATAVSQGPLPLPPVPVAARDTRYSLVVMDEPVGNVLFAIARDAKHNIDIHPGIEGTVTLNAIDQTLPQILNRISKQVDMRWEVEGQTILIMTDSPFLKQYKVDYVNVSRTTENEMSVVTQVSSGGLVASGTQSSGAANNTTTLKVKNESKNQFWTTLERNIKELLRETDKLLPEGSSETFVNEQAQNSSVGPASTKRMSGRKVNQAQRTVASTIDIQSGEKSNENVTQREERTLTFREAASVIINPETGIVTVRATSRQHEKISEFIKSVTRSAQKQVLVEATVVEVILNDRYQSGVDWSALAIDGLGWTFKQNFLGVNLQDAPVFGVQYRKPDAAVGGDVSSSVKMLNTFGDTKVLSSPRLMVLNNQTAVLKVVDNYVYFNITAQTNQNQTQTVTNFSTQQNSIPVGLVMNVTAQIDEGDLVTMNVRPSVSRIISFVNDPNPSLAQANVISRIPQIQTREIESVMRVASGQTAVLGGLMQDSFETTRDGLPVLSRVPLLNDAVSYRNDVGRKSELIVFLRPIVVRDASVEADLADYKKYLPAANFFNDPSPVIDLTKATDKVTPSNQ